MKTADKYRTCLNCRYYSMNGGEESGRMSFDFCNKKKKNLPTAAFSFDDLCCSNTSNFNLKSFSLLEEIAKNCDYFEKTD